MKRILFLALLALPLFAQDFVAAGAQFSGTTVTPFGTYAHALDSGIRLLETVQVTQIHVKPSITFQTVALQEFGYDVSTLLPVNFRKHVGLVGIGGAGASASSTSLAGAFDGGGLAVIHLPKLEIVLGARIIRTPQAGTQTVPVAAIAVRWN